MRCDPLPSNYLETAFFAEERGIVSAGAGFLDFQMEVFFSVRSEQSTHRCVNRLRKTVLHLLCRGE
jgi:hypothetical protein